MKKIKKIAIACVAFISISFLVDMTYAAYLNQEKIRYPIDGTLSDFSSYFAGGTGSEVSPYIVTTIDHLKNIQKLTVLNVFSSKTHFQLQKDITFLPDEFIYPIGTEDSPFMGQFNGFGNTMKNVRIKGSNTNDIGLFGYVHINASIRNFILESPIIEVLANDDNSGTLATTNPLDPLLESQAKLLGDILPSNLTNGVYTTFRIEDRKNTLQFNEQGKTHTVDIHYSISHPQYLQENTDGSFSIRTNAVFASENDFYACQIEAIVFAEYQGKIIGYTLERWQINIKGNKTILENKSDASGLYAFKTLHAIVQDDGSLLHNVTHPTYVGFFIGHLDGSASYLGLNGGTSYDVKGNGTILVNGRKVTSSSVLIGRSRNDNPLDASATNYFSQQFDMTKKTSVVFSANADYTTQHNLAIQLTQSFLEADDTVTVEYLRFYPSAAIVEDTYKQENVSFQSSALRLNKPLFTEIKRTRALISYYPSSFTIQNGLYLWTTQNTKNDLMSKFFSRNDEFEVTIKITYAASDSQLTGEGASADKFQILYNTYNPNAKVQLINSSYIFKNNNFQTLADTIYLPDQYPVLDKKSDEKVVQTKEIVLLINKNDSFWGSLWNSLLATQPFYPLLVIGIGSGVPTSTDANYIFTTQFTSASSVVDVLGLEVLFTSGNGNISTVVNNVDYLDTSTAPTFDSVTNNYTNWNKESGTKIQFDLSQDAMQAAYTFYRVNSRWGASTVYGTFNNANFPLTNAKGFKLATLSNV